MAIILSEEQSEALMHLAMHLGTPLTLEGAFAALDSVSKLQGAMGRLMIRQDMIDFCNEVMKGASNDLMRILQGIGDTEDAHE